MRAGTRILIVAAPVVVALAALALLVARGREAHGRAAFVGAAACARCHAGEYAAWRGSHHARAMEPATPATVLGRFGGTRFAQGRLAATFFRRGGRFLVNTEGPDGTPHDFEIRYTFGVYPLQQYLVDFPGGRMQALSIAWDARPASEGGQRWFSLEPTAPGGASNPPAWTTAAYTWNYMCADCHSTGVRKAYDAETGSYNTAWVEVNVACEACHGPGSAHLRWAAAPGWERRLLWHGDGLPAQLTERRGVRWILDASAGIAHRSAARTTDREIDVCAQCHARRVHIADGYAAGDRLLDHYIPELIQPDLYYPDGEQRSEDYDYGSFLQSRMYRAGVTCSDCHDPHTAKLWKPGNAVCAQCHRASAYDTPAHTFHAAGTPGAQCAACHMPATDYMQIQPRPDHAMSLPRPDLTVTLGVPNACNRCHADRDAVWAAGRIRAWYGARAAALFAGDRRFAGAFAADNRNLAGADDSLAAVAADPGEPAIVRASALARLGRYASPAAFRAAAAALRDPSGLVRLGALQVLDAAPAGRRLALVAPLLGDSTRAVRQGAAWELAPLVDSLPPSDRRAFASAAAEFVASQRYNADQPANLLTLGTFYTQIGRDDSATAEFRHALRLAPEYARSYPGLAARWRAQGHAGAADALLRALRPPTP